ncbi:hypothetical protein DP939_22010 [Spongiactinospora rosea]|uniref:Uncharacterized protein n=1 Tax=Spongiactinospora rosea TaxID=2248750 RepID=A0A366LVR9_9ACTN|nr:hypothetical protein [Spongiactinospora rosea]RBQ18045.1 hypothetical protein DP939_22010 [Spongiactinospora rosea]
MFAGFAPTAQAVPTNCTTGVNGSTAGSHCAGGTGRHQVAITVLHINPSVGYVYNTGPWVSAGTTSSAYFPPGQIISIRVNTR